MGTIYHISIFVMIIALNLAQDIMGYLFKINQDAVYSQTHLIKHVTDDEHVRENT